MDTQPNAHHLVLGELEDFLTGKTVADTHDERYRQKIAKILVLDNGFDKSDLISNYRLTVTAGDKKAVIKIDCLIEYQGKIAAVIKYAPGSLVTRRLPNIGLSRIIRSYQIPLVISCNGEDAEMMDGRTGNVLAAGMEHFPKKQDLARQAASFSYDSISKTTFEQASRIVYAFEVDGACPCDTDICITE